MIQEQVQILNEFFDDDSIIEITIFESLVFRKNLSLFIIN